jgi:putative phosphoesterase
MKIALISDIHANHFFLKKVLKAINGHQVDKIFCLGDLVGYYDKPNQTIELIRENNISCLKGNHDKYLLGELTYNTEKEYLYRIQNHKKELSQENLQFLSSLPNSIEFSVNNKKVFMTHSLPDNSEKYFRKFDEIDRELLSNFDYYFHGHTHMPIIYYAYGVCFVNPGSVGQPRDYTQKASFAVVDFSNELIQLIKVKINFDDYCNYLKNANFDDKLISILKRKL